MADELGLRVVPGSAAQAADGGVHGFAPAGLNPLDQPEHFAQQWLLHLCYSLPGANAALLSWDVSTENKVLTAWPPAARDREDMLAIVGKVRDAKREIVTFGRGQGIRNSAVLLIGYPMPSEPAVVVVEVAKEAAKEASRLLASLHWGAGWFEVQSARRINAQVQSIASRAIAGFDLLALTGDHVRLKPAALALANELCSIAACKSVLIGISNGSGAKVTALSHSAQFQRRSLFVATAERAMDEALDQDKIVSHPAIEKKSGPVNLAHGEFAAVSNAEVVLTVPLAAQRGFAGAITLVRDAPFTEDDCRFLQAVATAIGPVLQDKAAAERLIGGRIADVSADSVRSLVGSGHATLKLGTIAAVLAFVFLAVVTGEHRINAKAVLEGTIQRAAVAPFDGFVLTAPSRAGDVVQAGQTLALLDDKDLALERLRLVSEKDKLVQKHREALAKHDRTSMAVLDAQIKQADAQRSLVDEKLIRANVTAPISGLVVSGDLSQTLGAPVERGKVLFEIAPLDTYRVVLHVAERDVRYLAIGQTGRVALTGMPYKSHPMTVTKMMPVTSAEDGTNAFRVEAELAEVGAGLRPGMEGIGKVAVGEGRLFWIWTRSFLDWAQLTLWKWSP